VEEYARKAKDSWSNIGLPYFYAFPLMDCLLQQKETEEPGQMAFKLLHPRVKRLPDSLTGKLQSVIRAWPIITIINYSGALEIPLTKLNLPVIINAKQHLHITRKTCYG
jgi:hypothetical protein